MVKDTFLFIAEKRIFFPPKQLMEVIVFKWLLCPDILSYQVPYAREGTLLAVDFQIKNY